MLVNIPTQIHLHLVKDQIKAVLVSYQTNFQNVFAVFDLKNCRYEEVKKNEFLCLKKLSCLGTEILKIGCWEPVLEVYVLEKTQ